MIILKDIIFGLYFYQLIGVILFYLLRRDFLRKKSDAVLIWSLLWPIGLYLYWDIIKGFIKNESK